MKNKRILSKIARWWSNIYLGWREIIVIDLFFLVIGVATMILLAFHGGSPSDFVTTLLCTLISIIYVSVWMMLFEGLLGRL